MKHKSNKGKDGFTLVELIVVLVILAILAALLIPALTGYINKAKEKDTIAQCRQCVMAAQSISSERYGQGLGELSVSTAADMDEVLKIAEVSGEITEMTSTSYKITRLVYTAGNGIEVTYENGEYTVNGESSGGSSLSMDDDSLRSAVLDYFKTYNGGTTDSEALRTGATNLDVSALGLPEILTSDKSKIASWEYLQSGGKFFYWSTKSLENAASGSTVPVMRYNMSTGTYTVWLATVGTKSQNGVSYNYYSKYTAYAPSTTDDKTQSYDTMTQIYDQYVASQG